MSAALGLLCSMFVGDEHEIKSMSVQTYRIHVCLVNRFIT